MKQPILAICYDFDKTLSPDDMQAQGYIQSIDYEIAEFWKQSNQLASDNDMDQNLAYMYMMASKSRGKVLFTKETLQKDGGKVQLFPGVETWFDRINEYGKSKGVIVEHYIISSGLKEMIEGTKVATKFKKIYASSFYFDQDGVAVWPAQVVNYTTISYITSEKVSFINARGKRTIINPSAEVVPLVVFENDSKSEYEHLLRNHTNDGLAVNCMSIDDFKLMCKQLLSPIEIIEYLKWREAFYKKNGPINLPITETNNGFVLSKPQMNENLVQQYLYEKYGENAIYEDRLYYELFRQYVSVLYEYKQMESEINGCYEVIKFLAHLFRDEIKCFVERTEKALLIAKTKKFNLVGTLRNVQKEYAIVFTATEQGEQVPSEELLPVVFEKQKVHTLLQVITYWFNDNEYMIDFVLWQG